MKYTYDAKTEYEKYLEEINESAPESVIKAYGELREMLDNYIAEASEFEWKRGFNHAFRLIAGSKTER